MLPGNGLPDRAVDASVFGRVIWGKVSLGRTVGGVCSDVSSGVHFWVEAFNLGIEYVSTMKTLYRECYRFTTKFQMNQSCY